MKHRVVSFSLLALGAWLLSPVPAAGTVLTGTAALEEPPYLASTSDAGVKGDLSSREPDLAASGTVVAFYSESTNLDPAETDRYADVYVKDLVDGDVHLVTTSDSGVKSNWATHSVAISANGTSVAFGSGATNLDPGDADSETDVYVKDLETGDLVLASTSDAGVKGDWSSFNPDLSGSGDRVVFLSWARNLAPRDSDNYLDVYVKDLSSGNLVLASTSSTGVKADRGSAGFSPPAISRSGRYIAFVSEATNLDPADSDTIDDVYVKRISDGALFLASTSDTGRKGNEDSSSPTLSSKGTTVAFSSRSHSLVPGDFDILDDVFVKDILTGDITLASSSDDGVKANGRSYDAHISGNGRWVAFTSEATNLDPNDTDPDSDVYVKDLMTGNLVLISTSGEGDKGNSDSDSPSISGGGARVAFASGATNLDANDTGQVDVYVKEPTGCQIVGTPDDDVLVGTPGDDVVCGRGGSDVIDAQGGDDLVFGEGGDDVLAGGPGADTLDGGDDVDTLDYGGSAEGVEVDLGAERASFGDAEGDVIAGFEGLRGSAFDDVLAGDGTANTLSGLDGDDVLTGGGAADVLGGGSGTDLIGYEDSPAAVTVDLATSTVGGGDAEGDLVSEVEGVIGSAYADALTGDDSPNVFAGLGGADVMDGGGGLDLASYASSSEPVAVDLDAGTGSGGDAAGDAIVGFEAVHGSRFDDAIAGSSGDDSLNGRGGDDALVGGDGADTLAGGRGDDSMIGLAGDDVLIGGPGIDSFKGGRGIDTCADDVSGEATSCEG